jgi:hypothetical protein
MNLGDYLVPDHPDQEDQEVRGPLGTFPPPARHCRALAGGFLRRGQGNWVVLLQKSQRKRAALSSP